LKEHLKNMALFVEIARTGSFTRAAAALGVPVSTLSRRFAAFEKELGLQLINRDTRKIELTSIGREYFLECSRLVDEANVAHERLRHGRSEPAGRLNISMTPDFGVLVFSPLLMEFAQAFPAISFDLDLTSTPVDLITNNIDVAIRFGAPADSSITMRSLGTIQHGLYASPDYLAREGTPTSPAELAGHQGIRIRHATKAQYDQVSRDGEVQAIRMLERFQSNNLSMIRNVALMHLGIAIMPEIMAREALASGALVRLLPAWHFESTPVLALTPTRLLSAACRAFLDFLAERSPALFNPLK
jgi:DNA-binding transcriptional LysR family regulator